MIFCFCTFLGKFLSASWCFSKRSLLLLSLVRETEFPHFPPFCSQGTVLSFLLFPIKTRSHISFRKEKKDSLFPFSRKYFFDAFRHTERNFPSFYLPACLRCGLLNRSTRSKILSHRCCLKAFLRDSIKSFLPSLL